MESGCRSSRIRLLTRARIPNMAGWRWLKPSQGNSIRWKIFKARNWKMRIDSKLFLRTAKYFSATTSIPFENARRSCWELRRQRHKVPSERHGDSLQEQHCRLAKGF